jgi:hypothetical protein
MGFGNVQQQQQRIQNSNLSPAEKQAMGQMFQRRAELAAKQHKTP